MRTTRSISLLLFLLALPLAAACGDDGGGDALGTRQITIPLTYGPGGGNWGPQDATGTAEIDTATGLVEIVVTGLDPLTDDRYEGWLAGGGEPALSTGRFNTDASGAGSSTINVGDLSQRTYAFVVLTVEPEPDPSPDPDSRHSIGGDIPAL